MNAGSRLSIAALTVLATLAGTGCRVDRSGLAALGGAFSGTGGIAVVSGSGGTGGSRRGRNVHGAAAPATGGTVGAGGRIIR